MDGVARCLHQGPDLNGFFSSEKVMEIVVQVAYGEAHRIVGGHPSLGNWNVDAAPQMSWSEGDVWTLDINVPEGTDLEFKVRRCAALRQRHRRAIAMLPLPVPLPFHN